MASQGNYAKQILSVAGLLLLGLIISALSYMVTSRPFFSDTVSVWVFDIGQGDAILIDTGKEQVLIDGGPSHAILEKLEATIPVWDRTIEYMINTHPHADHINGLVYALDYYTVGEFYSDGQPYYTDSYEEFSPSVPLVTGTTIELSNETVLEVLWPTATPNETLEDPNDSSVTILLTSHGSTMLLTGDIGIEQENELELQDIDILKVAHHGGKTSTGESFLEATTPEIALISLGKDNDYGHPNPGVLNRLQRVNAEIFRTDLDGDIRIQFTPLGYALKFFSL